MAEGNVLDNGYGKVNSSSEGKRQTSTASGTNFLTVVR